ncbi:MAG: peptidoglycan DD-metalloendopeptidase family protein [Synergistaceae bacterium]|jgi:murein DD-endopeptidase MepM/ murein hydrolase activator NlpD|nr:peptidoglycan DD-metalloendopeptidase family protein [Synergistaceae bacterium]
MNKGKNSKRIIFLVMFLSAALLSYSCISYAAKNAGMYWYSFENSEISDSRISSEYVVVDAIDTRSLNADDGGIGPFKVLGPSFTNPEVEMYEEEEEYADSVSGDLPPAAPETSRDWTEIKVEAGSTLSKLAETHSVTINDIMQANELTDQHKLREGQILYVPKNSESVQSTLDYVTQLKNEALAKRKKAEPIKVTEYVVNNGDTLWSVANTFDLDVNSLFGSNKLSDGDILKVGAVIRVPNQDGIFITVKKGQTIEKLSKEYSIFPEAIMAANEMTSESAIVNGKELFLPGAKVVAFVESNGNKRAVSKNASDSGRRGFGWPVVGKISSKFGWRKDPVRGGRDFHTGLDIRAPRGRTITAAAAGKVVHSGWMGGYGRTIVISHGGNMTTLYGHCSKLLVGVGATVKRGQPIAQIGSTGRSTGNHVHFEVRSSGRPMNPIKYLK